MRYGIGNFFCLLTSAFLLMASAPTDAAAQSDAMKTEDLVRRSDVIVVGKVGRAVSEWNEDKSRIQTRVSVTVDQTMKGAPEGGTITIIVPGGEIGGVGEWYSHTPRFVQDENVVVFARKDSKGQYRVSGGERGKVKLEKDESTGTLIIPDFGPLDTFTTQVKNAVQTQEPETRQRQ